MHNGCVWRLRRLQVRLCPKRPARLMLGLCIIPIRGYGIFMDIPFCSVNLHLQVFLTIFRATITPQFLGPFCFFFESLESLNTILIDGWSLLGYIAILDRTWTDHISQSPSTFWVHIFLATTFHPWNLCLYNLSNFGCHDIQRSTSSNVLQEWMGMKWCVPHFQKKQVQFEHWIRWSFKFRQVFLGPHRCLLLTFPFLLLSPFPPNITNRNHTNPLV